MSNVPQKVSASVAQRSLSLSLEQVSLIGGWTVFAYYNDISFSLGLNQVTRSFKYVVGAVGFTMDGVMVMISAAAIIILQAALYFRNNEESRKGANRTYLWFFSHYIYLATLILTLQCRWSLTHPNAAHY